MRSRCLAILVLVLVCLPVGPAVAQEYGARLNEYEYPYPVRYHDLYAQGQSLEMVYMDVPATTDDGSDSVVLLLHGKNFSGAYWERTIDALTYDGYRVIAPDQVGFGKSSKPVDFQFSFHALARQTHDLLTARKVDSVTVVGHSMGGMLATRFALMYPERTERLVLVNPIGLEDWKRTVPYRTIREWYQREFLKTPGGVVEYMRESYFDGEWKPAYDPLVEIQAGWIRGPDYHRIARISARVYDMIFTQPVLYEFPDLSTRTLLIIGREDRTALGKGMVPDTVARSLGRYDRLGERAAERIPDAKLVELDGVGHVPHYEAFDRFYRLLTDFMGPGSP